MSYRNPGGPGGMYNNKKEENTTTDPSQLEYHQNKHKNMDEMTSAIKYSDPNNGPMRKSSTAGTYNFSKGFTLSDGASGGFADKHISDMKSNVSKAMDSTNRGSKIEKRWKDAGGVEILKHSDKISSGKYDEYYQKEDHGHTSGKYAYTMTKGEAEDFRNKGKSMSEQGPGAIPKPKDGISIHKGPGGNTIENIEGVEGVTRDKAIIYKAPKKVSIRKGDVTKEGTINTNQHIRGIRHYNQEEQTAQGVMTGANWQEKSRKYNAAAAQSKMLTKKEEKKQRKKEKKALVKGYRASSGIKSAMSKKTFLANKGF